MAALKVSAPNNLEWVVKRQVLADWMRPVGISANAPLHGDSYNARSGVGGVAVVFGLVWMVLTLPLLPFVLLLRSKGVTPWTITAVARPWGRRGPPMFLRYHVRGSEAADKAGSDLVAKLERGDGAPEVVGAERIE
ncbi:MAG: hypothetical protein ACXVRV_12385 [Gaiellaceae bacterium]